MSEHLDQTYPVLLTLGANIDPARNLRRAVAMLRQNHHLVVIAASPVYASAPVNAAGDIATDQDAFLNAALHITTDYYTPYTLKYVVLRFIEHCLGRVRTADKFAPRPIDLDIALYGDRVLALPDAQITLPDPDILTRAHVALPLADLAPEWVHPVTGQTLAAIAEPLRSADGPRLQRRDDLALL